MNLLEQICDYTLNLRLEDIPADARDLAKMVLYDSIGTGLGGYQRELGRKAARYAAATLPGRDASLLGAGDDVSLEGAAFANAVMIKILGMDDSHRQAGHIASQVVPALLAVAQAYGSSGEDILVAMVAAYDFGVRVGRQVRATQRERGFDMKGSVGALSTALAVARCAGLDRERMLNTVALAADLASGTEQYVYEGGLCDTKDLISGFAARNAIFAMRLAESDFYGPRGALDGSYGFFSAFGDGFAADTFADLGESFAIMGTAFKPHGGCRHTHQAIDAVQAIQSESQLDSRDIERISLSTYGYATRPSFRVDANPPSREVAGLSIRVSTAVALSRGSAFPQDFAYWDEPEARRLRNLIDLSVDSEIEARYPDWNGCRLRLQLASGDTRESFLPNMKGEPEFRMTDAELRHKFQVLTRDLMPAEQALRIYALCNDLESLAGVEKLLSASAAAELVPA